MARPTTSTLTVEEFYRLPDDGLRYELVEGHLLSEPLPGAAHGRVTARIVHLLSKFAKTGGIGVVLTADAGFVLARSPDTVRGPDVAFVAQERYEAAGDPATAFPGAPDLAVEVLSPTDRPTEVHAKVADYLAGGAGIVWVVDPMPGRETVTVYHKLLEPRVLHGDALLDGGHVLPGLSIPAAEMFPPPAS